MTSVPPSSADAAAAVRVRGLHVLAAAAATERSLHLLADALAVAKACGERGVPWISRGTAGHSHHPITVLFVNHGHHSVTFEVPGRRLVSRGKTSRRHTVAAAKFLGAYAPLYDPEPLPLPPPPADPITVAAREVRAASTASPKEPGAPTLPLASATAPPPGPAVVPDVPEVPELLAAWLDAGQALVARLNDELTAAERERDAARARLEGLEARVTIQRAERERAAAAVVAALGAVA